MTQTLYPSLAAMPNTGITGDVKVAPGAYTPASYSTPLNGKVSVDLRDVSLSASGGYLFRVTPGCQAVIRCGGEFDASFQNFYGSLNGIVDATLADGSAPAWVILIRPNGTAKATIYSKTQGGVVNSVVIEPGMTGLGSGSRHVGDVMLAFGTSVGRKMTGGGNPPSASPAAMHALDDNAGNVGLPGTIFGAFNLDLSGYVSSTFQGDSGLPECRMHLAIVSDCDGGLNTDSGMIDSKASHSECSHCRITSIGDRAISSHYGEMVCFGNSITQVATSPTGGQGKAYQGTGKAVVRGDVVDLSGTARLAVSNFVATQGSGPASTYPRVGELHLHGVHDSNGNLLLGPLLASPGQGYTPTVDAD